MTAHHSQWPAGAGDTPAKPLHSPTTKGKTPADGKRPIQTSKPPAKDGKR